MVTMVMKRLHEIISDWTAARGMCQLLLRDMSEVKEKWNMTCASYIAGNRTSSTYLNLLILNPFNAEAMFV